MLCSSCGLSRSATTNANLTGSQVIINTNVSHKAKMISVYNQVKAIATGTIIEFTE